MKVIMLAAGVGKRMSAVTDKIPKCLIKIGEKTLLERHLETISLLGIEDIVFVVGHFKEKIKETVERSNNGFNIKYIENEQYTKGSILSLWYARNELNDDVLIMDADVLYHEKLLRKLVKSKHNNCFLLDPNCEDTGEEMMLFIKEKKVVGISKVHSYDCDFKGEGVGFFKLAANDCHKLRTILEEFEQAGKVNVEYEDTLHELISQHPAGFESVNDLPWIEIDFEEDIERARREILPKIENVIRN
ncbi:sugar nucleotidyltransferase [Candidatus Scalindua japonica]|uniref:Sugar nucleotidyltransferase n=1 Tax=Candidatus Scalindua japonica TaxID=1284222 RepID=A0A286TYE2_9BACT|nr:phosphocholine cytidylyltransferase family protein [Candidatus Scalindua japonica]GAX60897.1 sugar nucleotidyltransferase [Candidatus Scalindua japonica]